MLFTNFEKKMITVAVTKGLNKYSDMPHVFCLAEFDEGDYEMEGMLEEYLKTGKKSFSPYIYKAGISINKVWKHLSRQYSEDVGDADTNIRMKKYVVVFNQIDGIVKNDPFYTYAFSKDLANALERILTLSNFNQGEWDMKIYITNARSKVVQKYGYYHEIKNSLCLYELSYMDDPVKKYRWNEKLNRITINNETFEV